MTTGTKNIIRITVLAGLLAWPGIETARLMVAKKEVQKSAELQRSINDRWASLKRLQTPTPAQAGSETAPVGNPTPPTSNPLGI